MEMGVYFIPSSRTAILFAFCEPPNWLCHASRTFCGSLITPVCSSTPLGAAPFAKNFAPYSSQAIAMPIAFFAIAIGEYPTSPSKPNPGMCRTLYGVSRTVVFFMVSASSEE